MEFVCKKDSVPNFTDVRPDAYFYDAVVWVAKQGITVGINPATFSPNDTCTRGQIVTFLYRDRTDWQNIQKD